MREDMRREGSRDRVESREDDQGHFADPAFQKGQSGQVTAGRKSRSGLREGRCSRLKQARFGWINPDLVGFSVAASGGVVFFGLFMSAGPGGRNAAAHTAFSADVPAGAPMPGWSFGHRKRIAEFPELARGFESSRLLNASER